MILTWTIEGNPYSTHLLNVSNSQLAENPHTYQINTNMSNASSSLAQMHQQQLNLNATGNNKRKNNCQHQTALHEIYE